MERRITMKPVLNRYQHK